MEKTEENDKSNLKLKSVSKPGGSFGIHSLNNFREVGSYTWIAREITDEMGFPDCVKDTDDCHFCEGQLFVLRHGGTEETNQSTDSFGQVLTIINHETGATNIYTRAVHPLDRDEWKPWQMVATGDPKLIAENNSINEVLSALRQQVENDSKRIETAENSLLASATVRFDRIEENETTINAGEIDSTPTAIVYYKPTNKFVAADSAGNYWDTWDGIDAYMSGGTVRKDKVYLCGGTLYVYHNGNLVNKERHIISQVFTQDGNIYTGRTVEGFISSSGGGISKHENFAKARCCELLPVEAGKVYCISGRREMGAIRAIDADGNVFKVLAAMNGKTIDTFYLPNADGSSSTNNGQFRVPYNAIYVQFGITLQNEMTAGRNMIVLELVGDEYDENFTPSVFGGYGTFATYIAENSLPPATATRIAMLEESSRVAIVDDIQFSGEGYAYNAELGAAPVLTATEGYSHALVENIKTGDIVEYSTFSGSTRAAITFVKGGIVVSKQQAYGAFAGVIKCDAERYDSILFNYYYTNPVDAYIRYTYFENKSDEVLKRCERVEYSVEGMEVDIEKSKKTITEDVRFEAGKPWDANTVGIAPAPADNINFAGVSVEGVQVGDVFRYKIFGGSTYSAVALVKDDIVVDASARQYGYLNGGAEIELIADGSFDTVVFNVYTNERMLSYVKYTKTRYLSELEPRKKSIKILCFGNSFTQDSMGYVPNVLMNIAPELDVVIGIAYIAGSVLANHLANFTGENVVLGTENFSPQTYTYQKSVNAQPWTQRSGFGVDALLSDEDWDIVTFQQGSRHAALDYDTYYAPFIYALHRTLYSKLSRGVSVGWLLTHGIGDSNESHWASTAANSQKVAEGTATGILFPYGTAVQNLRSYMEDDLLADGTHLQEGIGCLCAAYSNALVLLRCAGFEGVGIVGDRLTVDLSFLKKYTIPGLNWDDAETDLPEGDREIIGMNDEYRYVAQVAAIRAVGKPYELTELKSLA